MRLVSVLNRDVTIEFTPEELHALARAMGDAWQGCQERWDGRPGEQAEGMLLEAWGTSFKALAMAGAACSLIPKAHEGRYNLREVEREFTRAEQARKRA